MKQRFTKRTRLVSALLTLAMVFTFLPFSAFAANTEIDFNSPDFVLKFKDAEFQRFLKEKYSLQGTTQGNGLTGGVPPVRFSM